MNGIVAIALLVGMFFTGSCILNLMMWDQGDDIGNPYDMVYVVGFLFGMLTMILTNMI